MQRVGDSMTSEATIEVSSSGGISGDQWLNSKRFAHWFIKYICRKMDTTPYALRSQTRIEEIMKVRRICCFYLWKYTVYTSKEIANEVGLSNHSSVLHHVGNYQNSKSIYPACEELHDEIERELRKAYKRGKIGELTTLPNRS